MTDTVLDERGKRCPAPILALGRALRSRPPGSRIILIADDPVALTDVPAWCSLVGATIERQEPASLAAVPDGAVIRFVLLLP